MSVTEFETLSRASRAIVETPSTGTVPDVLEISDTLHLRAITEEDALEIHNLVMRNRRELTREYKWAAGRSLDMTKSQFASIENNMRRGIGAHYAIVEAGRAVGKIQAETRVISGTQVDYWIDRYSRRRGVATEALGRLVKFLFDDWDVAAVDMLIRPANAASRAVARKNGGKRIDGPARDYHLIPKAILSMLPREQWRISRE